MFLGIAWAQLAAGALAALGVAMAGAGALAHLAWLEAPGAAALVLGSAWLGVLAARRP